MAGGKPVGYSQAWPRIGSRGYRETNPGSDQSGSQTRDRRNAGPTCWLLGHLLSPRPESQVPPLLNYDKPFALLSLLFFLLLL